ncbi:MAG TPA: hypothetical protein VI489_03985, partial [Candidatus Brocadiaceae bacterium]
CGRCWVTFYSSRVIRHTSLFRSTERSSELTPKTHDEVKGGKVPSPLVGECLGEGYFRINIISIGKL